MRATMEELGGVYKSLVSMLKHPCRACDAGKMTRRPSRGHLPRGRFYGDVLHADIQEYEVEDMHGHWYNLMLVEDVSRGKWSMPLKLKSDAGAAIQRFCHQEFVPLILRTDGGGEFSKKSRPRVYLFDSECRVLQVCALYGIHKQETVAEDHDQMGVAEAANRRAAEGVRTMMYAANLPKETWGDLIMAWCDIDWFIVNRAEGFSPFYIRYGRPPLREVAELRTIGARVTYYGKREDDPKLAPKGHRGIFLGRNYENGGFKVLDVEAIDPVVRTITDINKASFDENIKFDFEPTGVDDESIRLTNEKMPLQTVWHYPPVRAVQETGVEILVCTRNQTGVPNPTHRPLERVLPHKTTAPSLHPHAGRSGERRQVSALSNEHFWNARSAFRPVLGKLELHEDIWSCPIGVRPVRLRAQRRENERVANTVCDTPRRRFRHMRTAGLG